MRIATARKAGRNPRFPYVPVIVLKRDGRRDIESQVRGFAFATRAEALAFAERTIAYQDERQMRRPA